MSMIQLKKIFYSKNIKSIFTMLLLLFSVISFASENNIDAKINQIISASPQEKTILIDELKNDISTKKYNSSDTKKTTNKSIDEKIQNRESKSIPMSKCGIGKCGMSHSSKCGMSN